MRETRSMVRSYGTLTDGAGTGAAPVIVGITRLVPSTGWLGLSRGLILAAWIRLATTRGAGGSPRSQDTVGAIRSQEMVLTPLHSSDPFTFPERLVTDRFPHGWGRAPEKTRPVNSPAGAGPGISGRRGGCPGRSRAPGSPGRRTWRQRPG